MYDKIGDKAYPYQIHKNALPQCDVFLKNDYTKEEMKLVQETHKILEDPSIGITATAIRIPVVGGHSESVNIEFELKYDIKKVRTILNKTIGVEVIDDPKEKFVSYANKCRRKR